MNFFFWFITNNSFAQKPIVITGHFEGASENDKVYVESNKGLKDSSIITKRGFKFSLSPASAWDVYFVRCPKVSKTYVFPLFLRAGSVIDFSINKALDSPAIAGDKMSMQQNDFYKGLASIHKWYNTIQERIAITKDKIELTGLNKQLGNINAQISHYPISWVEHHPGSPFSVAVINLFITHDLKQGRDTVAERCFELLLPEAIKNNFQTYLLTRKFSLFNDKYKLYSEDDAVHGNSHRDSLMGSLNKLAPDFSLNDTSGVSIKLIDFKNNYLLIDFWASWCGPCRENNPELKKLYHAYKDKGLEVLSISVDTDARKWKAAIQDDKMDWFQVSDLLGIENGVAFKYNIAAVPTYFLIAPDGSVEMVSIGGDVRLIESKLNQVFK